MGDQGDSSPAIIAGGLTQSQIDQLKKKHGPLTLCEVKTAEHEFEYFWFKKPDMKVISAVTKFLASDPLRANQIYFKNCLVEGDSSAADDVELFTSLMPYLTDLVKTFDVQVKNF